MLNSSVLGITRSPDDRVDGRDTVARSNNPNSVSSDALVDQLLADERYALLLRPQIAQTLQPRHRALATEMLVGEMAEVPAGDVAVELWMSSIASESNYEARAVRVDVERLYVDRCAVTNNQFQKFVDARGYAQRSLWHPSVGPRVAEFVDSTGKAGPKSWVDGHFDPESFADHPVVGVSWFEADAFARWVGKRLPYDAEWVKAASWPVAAGAALSNGRRYPWGETIDQSRANLWFSGCGKTAPVASYEAGMSAGGIHQMVGNVWEWTSSEFQIWVDDIKADLAEPLMSIRGAAFDTYFERHAGCQSQSGERPMDRRHNIGIRCAVSACDIADSSTSKQFQSEVLP